MRRVLIAMMLLFNTGLRAQVLVMKLADSAKGIDLLQKAFNRNDISCIVIGASFILDGVLKIPPGKTIRFEPGCIIKGKGIINGGIIDAGYQQTLFDTSLTVNPEGVNQYFSAKWFGAKGANTDDYAALQKSIKTCINNNIRTLYIPSGNYKISKPLILRSKGDTAYDFCTLEILGESSFWDSNKGTEIFPMFTDGFAIGIQRGKGCKIRKLRITGKFKPPNLDNALKFFNTSFENFTDGICRDKRNSPYAGIVIDPFTNIPESKTATDAFYPGLKTYYGTNGKSRESGSTATEIEEISLSGFVVGICSSPNGVTRNADITLINKVQFANCKLCISGGQDQEKANMITNIHCWGGAHTIFATGLYGSPRMAGNWNIDHVNIAGNVVRFISNDQHGYFASYVSHIYAELLGTWGTLNSQLACEVSDCNVDFAYESIAGKRTLLTSWGKNVVYRSCNFRFYGENTPLNFEGDCVFDHCFFSGPVQIKNGMLHSIYNPGSGINTQLLLFYVAVMVIMIAGIIFWFYRRHHPQHAISESAG